MKSIGILGYGHFGEFLVTLIRRFRPELEILVSAPDQTIDQQLFHSLESTVSVDVLFLAVPISEYAAVLDEIKPLVARDTVVVDIATVKDYTAKLIKSTLPEARFLSLHPMFGPASYAKCDGNVDEFRIALTDTSLSHNELEAAQAWIQALGFRVIHMGAEEHDRILAETLFLTHYVGQVITSGGFRRSDIDTVSFAYLMDAVDSVKNDTDLFVDVSLYNPFCAEVIERFDRAEHDVKLRYLGKMKPLSGEQ